MHSDIFSVAVRGLFTKRRRNLFLCPASIYQKITKGKAILLSKLHIQDKAHELKNEIFEDWILKLPHENISYLIP